MTRTCVRCSDPAAAMMRFDYAAAEVWLDELSVPIAPRSGYALCHRHADRLTAPVGWHLADRRSPMRPLFDLDVA